MENEAQVSKTMGGWSSFICSVEAAYKRRSLPSAAIADPLPPARGYLLGIICDCRRRGDRVFRSMPGNASPSRPRSSALRNSRCAEASPRAEPEPRSDVKFALQFASQKTGRPGLLGTRKLEGYRAQRRLAPAEVEGLPVLSVARLASAAGGRLGAGLTEKPTGGAIRAPARAAGKLQLRRRLRHPASPPPALTASWESSGLS